MKSSRDDVVRYALVSGHGRSGTNWLLSLLDLSPRTFCRNEPAALESSPLKKLEHDRFVKRSDQTPLAENWDEAVGWTASHMGERDQTITMPKDHMVSLSRTLGLYRIVRGPKYRKALGTIVPSLRGSEWPIPSLVFDRARLNKALPILKLVSSPGWSDYVLRQRPAVPLFHILRHPGGYLHSWTSRYRSQQDEETTLRQNRARLETLAREHPSWGDRFGDIAAMTTEESELWYWCYAAETIDRAGEGRSAYYRIIYEELTSNPIPVVKRCYEMCHLDWSPSIEQAVLAASQASPGIAAKWRTALNDDQSALVTRILDQSGVKEYWPKTESG